MNKNEQEIIFRFTPNQTSAKSNAEKIYSSLLLAPTYNGPSDKSLIENSKANLVDMAQSEQFNILLKFIDVLKKSGNINFVNVSLAALFISSSLFLLLIVTFFVLKLNLCKSKSSTNTNKQTQSANSSAAAAKQSHHKHETSCEKNSQNTMSITNISLDNKIAQKKLISNRLVEKSKNKESQISNRKDLSTFSVNSSNEQQRHIANSSHSFLCKCLGRSNSTSNKKCREKGSNLLDKNNYVAVTTSTAAAVVVDASSDSATTAFASLPDTPSPPLFKPHKQFVINCTSCIGPVRSDRRRITTSTNSYKSKRAIKPAKKSLVTSPHHQINKIKKQVKYTTQFSISFHKFSLRSPSVSSLARRKLVNSTHQNNEYKSQASDMLNQRCCLSVSVVPFDRSNSNNNNNNNNANNPSNNHNNNSGNAKSKNKNKKKPSSKQIFEDDDLNDSYSREKPINNKLSSSVLDNPVATSKSPSLVLSNNSDYEPHSSAKSASLINHNDFHKIDLLISSKKAAAAAAAASTAGVATISSIETEDDKIAKQVALFKQKNICSKEPSPSLLSQQLNRNSSTSTSTLESFQVQQTETTMTTTSPPPQPPLQPQPSKSVNTNELLSINIENTNHNLNNTINSRYQHFEKSRNKLVSTANNSNSSANSNNSSLASKNLNSFGEEIFDFSLRINRLRFIDDSASSTALTSPAESINNFFSHFNNNNNNINRQHKPQQQHNKLHCNSGLATLSHHNSQLSVNTSSSRTISMVPSSTNESCASTPGSGSIGAGLHLPSSNSKRMLVPIKRQENVKSSTETICSNDTHSLASSSATSATTKTENKQFQHELLENYRKPSTSVPHHHHHHQQPDNEDDEEIKNIILNNLNEKLKTGTSAAVTASKHHYHHHHHHHRPKHHQLHQAHQHYRKKVQSAATIADCSSSSYTTTELDSSSSECEPVAGVNHQHFHYYSGLRQTAVTAKPINKASNKHSSNSSSSSNGSTAHTSPPLDYNEIVCNSCCKKNQNTNTHMPTLTVAASNSNCKYCKLLLNYETTSSEATSTAASISNQRSPSNIGYSPAIAANSNRIKSKGDDRVYAYENFDCINECLEEADILNQIIDSKINSRKIQKVQLNNSQSQNEENQYEEEDDDEDTTSILVEDGFIRMSSPVGNEDKQQNDLDNVKLTNKSRINKPVNQSIKQQQQQQLTNFPNVGSSPLSEEFLNSDCSSSENEEIDDDERTLNEAINDQEENNEEENLKENSDSFDGIIILGSLKKNNSKFTDQLNSNAVLTDGKEALSLSDDEEIVVEEDEDEEEEEEKKTEYVEFNNSATSPIIEETVSTKANTIQNDQPSLPQSLLIGICNKQPPHSIMKQKPSYSDLNKTIYNRNITNLEQSSSSSIVSNGSVIQPMSPTSGINITNAINAANNNNVLSASNNLLLSNQSLSNSNSQSVPNQAISSINQTTHHPPKPKVRFNLDINYEKEREWNRASKLIGDASKTQIEWTQEVEV